MPDTDTGQVYLDVTPDPIARQAQDIAAALKGDLKRGEPSAQLVDRLLILQLQSQATALRKAARIVNDTVGREALRNIADDLDPFLR